MRPNIHCDLINGPFGDPAVYADVMFERRALLFDLGDVSTLAPRKLLRITHVFVSHAHMDHFAGFDHLLRLLLGRDKLVHLYGPADFIDKVEHKLRAYTWNVIHNYIGNLVFEVGEVFDDITLRRARFQSAHAFEREIMPEQRLEADVLAYCGALLVQCAVLDHGTPCLGFALQEPAHFNIWKTKLEERGLVVGPWLRDLKRAIQAKQLDSFPIQALRRSDQGVASVSVPLHALREVVQVTPGQKIAYIVDVRYHDANAERIERLASGADILFIEAAFLEADTAHAARKNHLTAGQAGLLARRAQVKRVVPFHFSTRYSDRADALSQETQRAFSPPTAGMGPE